MKFNKKNMIEAVQRKLNQYTEHGLKSDAEALLFQAILLHLQSAVVVREGFKVVPVEPTEAMLTADYDVLRNEGWRKEIYKAMLAAAPDYRDGYRQRLTPVELHTNYIGPTKWGVITHR